MRNQLSQLELNPSRAVREAARSIVALTNAKGPQNRPYPSAAAHARGSTAPRSGVKAPRASCAKRAIMAALTDGRSSDSSCVSDGSATTSYRQPAPQSTRPSTTGGTHVLQFHEV
eukprot:6240199-Prymnesium_polylepis.1